MSSSGAPRRERSRWPWIALLLVGIAGGVGVWLWPAPTPVPQPVAALPAARPSVPAVTAPATAGPSFDVVRIGPEGRAVIAGRAEPGAEITVRDGGRPLGTARADAAGQFVLLPDAALPPGARELTVSVRRADGTEVVGTDSVFLVVPERAAPAVAAATTLATEPAAPVAVLLPGGVAAPRVLTGASRKLGLSTVDYDEGGDIRFAGSAPPDATVRLYVDDRPAGDARADAAGQWTLRPSAAIAPGTHRVRVDQVGPGGRVLARVELPFQRATLAADAGAAGRTIVQPGQNLWRIARQSYGQGTRFTVIFLANRDQIRDPNRIYPGQVFAVPPRS